MIPTKHVLVVDDEPSIRSFLHAALRVAHCTADLAEDGQEAWNKLRSGIYACIILDMKMPKMGGQELYQRIGESDRELAKRVIFITGDIISRDIHAFIASTGNPALNKPFKIAQLREMMARVC